MAPAQWLALARDDLRAAELLADHELDRLACGHAAQAAEKAARALRLHHERRRAADPTAAPPPIPLASPEPTPAARDALCEAREYVSQVTACVYGGEG